ncbi:hypothetical protein A3K63_04420 [Candidatus Micrarchaeota archaeon RBG_16_49_10]|nr:MAG: hypothetical protein A3K63_04420 [Candidatus Micrarchaeota archaeon RBG_16_49_10]
MSLERLLKDRIIRKVRIDKELARKTFEIASRDIEVAGKVLEGKSYNWSLAISYNSMLQAGRALMFSRGFKPAGEYKHVAVVKFLHEEFGKDLTDRMIGILDRMRKKRHAAVYDAPDIVSVDEARNALKWAKEFMKKVEAILKNEGFV